MGSKKEGLVRMASNGLLLLLVLSFGATLATNTELNDENDMDDELSLELEEKEWDPDVEVEDVINEMKVKGKKAGKDDLNYVESVESKDSKWDSDLEYENDDGTVMEPKWYEDNVFIPHHLNETSFVGNWNKDEEMKHAKKETLKTKDGDMTVEK